MLEAFISGFWQTVAWPAFGYMLIGIAIGFFVGLLPGIGGLSTLALMLPFSYSIKEPISAFAFLLGMLAVTGTTGDLTSILFGIPGEGSSAALILDGYPMSKNGEAGRALGAAIMSSVLGSVIGALSLALSIPIMRPLVLLFGSPELFVIAIMGITFIGTLAGPSLIKGLLAGGIGLMLAAIGVDPQTGSLRYTFGTLYLWDRLDLIPVVVGMFAIPEIVDLAVRGTSIASGKTEKLHGVMDGVKDCLSPLLAGRALQPDRRLLRRPAGSWRQRRPMDLLRPRGARLEGQIPRRQRRHRRSSRPRRSEQLDPRRRSDPNHCIRHSWQRRHGVAVGCNVDRRLKPRP